MPRICLQGKKPLCRESMEASAFSPVTKHAFSGTAIFSSSGGKGHSVFSTNEIQSGFFCRIILFFQFCMVTPLTSRLCGLIRTISPGQARIVFMRRLPPVSKTTVLFLWQKYLSCRKIFSIQTKSPLWYAGSMDSPDTTMTSTKNFWAIPANRRPTTVA